MANDNSGSGDVRRPDPEAAATDQENAATRDQIERDTDAQREQARRVEASVPAEVRDRTVGEIVDDANRRRDAGR